ncbi:hypothetical protein P43SY_006803 [Pythium insidiosum]|uniref:Uncharacterized protein n=1 Tax=Pythium insidiosum TaxID=114742 RepID=A0AAD5LII1_PYTIN|nr:hypothetical protein P43SY_006803 [Pythium insidiosum]
MDDLMPHDAEPLAAALAMIDAWEAVEIPLEPTRDRVKSSAPSTGSTDGDDAEELPSGAPSSSVASQSMCTGSRRKREIEYLRSKACELEAELAALKARAAESWQSAAVASTTALWEQIATRQLTQRVQSEKTNARLRMKLQHQVQVARDLMRALTKAARRQDVDELAGASAKRVKTRELRVDEQVEIQQRRVDALLGRAASVFASAHFQTTRPVFRDVELFEDSLTGDSTICIRTSWAVPFSAHQVAAVIWRFMVQKAQYGGDEALDRLNIVYSTQATRPGMTGTFAGRLIARRHVLTPTAQLLAWVKQSEPLAFEPTPLDGVLLDEEALLRVQPAAKPSGHDSVTLVQSWRRLRVHFNGDDVVGGRRKVGALSEYLLSQVETELNWKERVVENLLLEEAMASASQGYFTTVFVVRELVEAVAQCVQAYKFSRLIARSWINHVWVLSIVLDCWGTPLITRFLLRDLARRRYAYLVSDVVVTIVTAVVLPTVIFVPWALQFDRQLDSFPPELLYDDKAFTQLLLESRSILAISTVDCVTKAIAHLGILHCLRAIRGFVDVPPAKRTALSVPRNAVAPGSSGAPNGTTSGPRRRCIAGLTHALHLVGRVFFFLLGAVVVGAHLHAFLAHRHLRVDGCKQLIHPWFVQGRASCVVFEFSCYEQAVDTPGDVAFSSFHADVLQFLVISHCPALVVPTTVRSFASLSALEIYNSTLVAWPQRAAFDAARQDQLAFVGVIRVNMSEFPRALLSPLPRGLNDVEFVVTNLTAIPDDLDLRWPALSVVFIEHSLLTQFPMALLRMQTFQLSLAWNRISALPFDHEAAVGRLPYALIMAGNPIRTLPDTLAPSLEPPMTILSLENTQVTGPLPPWTTDGGGVAEIVYLAGAPLCDEPHDETPTVALLACDLVCAAFLWFLGSVHVYLDDPTMTYYAASIVPAPSLPHFTAWGNVFRAIALLHVLDISWFSIVAAAHLHAFLAHQHIRIDGCIGRIHPWFVHGRPSCVKFEFSCYRENVSTPTASEFDSFQPDALQALIISHCPALVVPSVLRTFHLLTSMDIYNATLIDWPRESAFDPATQPHVGYLGVVRVNMSTFPTGLEGPLPAALTDVEFVATNLTGIPDDLDLRWPVLSVFYVEHSLLTQFPMVVLRMNIFQLSLLGNQIATLPIETTDALPFVFVMSGNPISVLPQSIASAVPIGFLFVENTHIAAPLPTWITDGIGVTDIVFLFGSQLCGDRTMNMTQQMTPMIICDVPSEFQFGLVQDQAKLLRCLNRLIKRALCNNSQMRNDFILAEKRVQIDVSFEALLQLCDDMIHNVDTAFSDKRFMVPRNCQLTHFRVSDVTTSRDANGNAQIDMLNAFVLPFNVSTTADAIWQYLALSSSSETEGFHAQNIGGDDVDIVKKDLRVELKVNRFFGRFQGRIVARQRREVGRVVIVWVVLVKPVEVEVIRSFRFLSTLDIYNSTLVAWPREAAFDAEAQTRIGFVGIVRVNMSTLPEALLEPLPIALNDIEIVATNLTALPADLDARWSAVRIVPMCDDGSASTQPSVPTIDCDRVTHYDIGAYPLAVVDFNRQQQRRLAQ